MNNIQLNEQELFFVKESLVKEIFNYTENFTRCLNEDLMSSINPQKFASYLNLVRLYTKLSENKVALPITLLSLLRTIEPCTNIRVYQQTDTFPTLYYEGPPDEGCLGELICKSYVHHCYVNSGANEPTFFCIVLEK